MGHGDPLSYLILCCWFVHIFVLFPTRGEQHPYNYLKIIR